MKEACFTKSLTVAFSEEVYNKVKAVTDQKRISMGEWVRVAVEEALADDKYFERMEGDLKNETRI
jgi:hypothetical protein